MTLLVWEVVAVVVTEELFVDEAVVLTVDVAELEIVVEAVDTRVDVKVEVIVVVKLLETVDV